MMDHSRALKMQGLVDMWQKGIRKVFDLEFTDIVLGHLNLLSNSINDKMKCVQLFITLQQKYLDF